MPLRAFRSTLIAGLFALCAHPAAAEDFYAGKTVVINVGSAAGGSYDLYARMVARHIPGSEISIITESGHSAYWEQPEMFNRALLDFLRKH